MAKQSGIHQIRGKVGEHSYYKTTGVQAGLIRSINQGLSNRVKNDAAYANTRLNNAEFGQAGRIAKALGKLIFPKYRPMVLPFSQSKMAAFLLRYIKQDTALWGFRNINDPQGEILSSTLNEVSKGDFSNFGVNVNIGSNLVVVTSSQQFVEYLQSIGATGAIIQYSMCTVYVGKRTLLRSEYIDTLPIANVDSFDISSAESNDFSINWPALAFVPEDVTTCHLLVMAIYPYREVNGESYTLQEHCTYRAFASVAGDTPEP